jgi:hypothetical protein
MAQLEMAFVLAMGLLKRFAKLSDAKMDLFRAVCV